MTCKSCDGPNPTAIAPGEAADNHVGLTPTCRWCGKAISHMEARFCGECDRPRHLQGYLIAAASFIGTTLFLPSVLILVTYLLNSEQQRIANRQKLADAYVAFGTTMTDYRRAAATFDLLAKSANERIKLAEVKKALLDFDAAFNAIGAKLGPFQESAQRSDEYGAASILKNLLPGNSSTTVSKVTKEIATTWNHCFVAPYYGSSAVPAEKSYWRKMNNLLRRCTAESCPRAVAERISEILSDIWTGTCVCGKPEQHRPLNWVYTTIQSLLEERDIAEIAKPPGKPIVSKPNPDLLAPDNLYCISQLSTSQP
jgi:hypothetical protein